MSRSSLTLTGRVLWLTEDATRIREQLRGKDLGSEQAGVLRSRVSTDEITPAWACYYFDATLARYCLVGLAGADVQPGEVSAGGFEVVVAGESFGYGSSRETAPFALQQAGVRLIVARSVEKIFAQNCQNLGLYVTTDFSVLDRLLAGAAVRIEELVRGLDTVAAEVVRRGGLFEYNRARLARELPTPAPRAPDTARPMTLVEKILARHCRVDGATTGVAAVAPGDSVFVRADLRFSHDYVTAMADALFQSGLGEDARVHDPSSLVLFRDHLTLLGQALTPRHRALGLYDHALELKRAQERFAARHGVRLYDELTSSSGETGSYGICHNVVVDELAKPGEVVVGTDSHTCTAGAVGAFAFGVGSTDMANAFATGDVRVRVPESVRIELTGSLRRGVTAKDVMLALLSREDVRRGAWTGRVLEFAGAGLAELPLDERATLCNMAVEASAFTAIVPFDERARAELSRRRGPLPTESVTAALRPDEDARYADRITLDLAEVEPMVATPGDPRHGVALRDLVREQGRVRIDIAYGGSCTGSKLHDLEVYAGVLARGLSRGERVAEGVQLFIQLGSARIAEQAAERGLLEVFERAGARVLPPACGACIGAGPGVSESAEQVTVSAVNRNFPGRSGPGQVYLASPHVVAESALSGYLTLPLEVRSEVTA